MRPSSRLLGFILAAFFSVFAHASEDGWIDLGQGFGIKPKTGGILYSPSRGAMESWALYRVPSKSSAEPDYVVAAISRDTCNQGSGSLNILRALTDVVLVKLDVKNTQTSFANLDRIRTFSIADSTAVLLCNRGNEENWTPKKSAS